MQPTIQISRFKHLVSFYGFVFFFSVRSSCVSQVIDSTYIPLVDHALLSNIVNRLSADGLPLSMLQSLLQKLPNLPKDRDKLYDFSILWKGYNFEAIAIYDKSFFEIHGRYPVSKYLIERSTSGTWCYPIGDQTIETFISEHFAQKVDDDLGRNILIDLYNVVTFSSNLDFQLIQSPNDSAFQILRDMFPLENIHAFYELDNKWYQVRYFRIQSLGSPIIEYWKITYEFDSNAFRASKEIILRFPIRN